MEHAEHKKMNVFDRLEIKHKVKTKDEMRKKEEREHHPERMMAVMIKMCDEICKQTNMHKGSMLCLYEISNQMNDMMQPSKPETQTKKIKAFIPVRNGDGFIERINVEYEGA